MRKKDATYTTLFRALWIALAIFITVFCGPIRRYVEYQMYKGNAIDIAQAEAHKLRAWHKEKHEVSFIHAAHQQSEDDGVVLFLISTLITAAFLYRRKANFYPFYTLASRAVDVPLYLHFRRLLV